MNKTAKAKLTVFSFLALILISVFALGAGQTNDIPTSEIYTPAVLTTIENKDGLINITIDSTIPSGDSDVSLRNATLYTNYTNNINYTWFVDPDILMALGNRSIYNTTYDLNQTITFTGLSNQTNFSILMTIPNDEYINWQVVVCTNVTGLPADQGNCTYSTNTSAIMDIYDFDSTNPGGSITYPSNDTVVHNFSALHINFSVTDNEYVKSVAIYTNFTTVENLSQFPCNATNSVLNQTINNSGAVLPFFSNSLNVTLSGNLSDYGLKDYGTLGYGPDGFYCAWISVIDNSENGYNTSVVYWEVDNTAPSLISSQFENVSLNGSYNAYRFNLTTTEPANRSIKYGITSGTNLSGWTQRTDYTSFTNGTLFHNLTNLSSGKYYDYNITICDEHDNCNTTAEPHPASNTFYQPYGARVGLSSYALLFNSTLREIADNITGLPNTVSMWNRSDQAFVNYVLGLSANDNVTLTRGDAFFVDMGHDSYFNAYGSMFNERAAGTELYTPVNLTGTFSGWDGNWTFVGLLKDWTMGNITANTELEDNITLVSHYNNSAQGYVDSIWGYSINNYTNLSVGDTLWLWTASQAELIWYRNITTNL